MWTLDVKRNQESWVLAAGYFGDPDVGQWLVFVETRGARHLFRRLRGRPPRWTVDELAAALHSVIVDDLEARPRWYSKEEWMAGPQGPGTPTPVTP